MPCHACSYAEYKYAFTRPNEALLLSGPLPSPAQRLCMLPPPSSDVPGCSTLCTLHNNLSGKLTSAVAVTTSAGCAGPLRRRGRTASKLWVRRAIFLVTLQRGVDPGCAPTAPNSAAMAGFLWPACDGLVFQPS